MIFEEIGVSQVDKNLQCLKIQIESKIYLIGLQDIEQAIKGNKVIPVFQISETPMQKETRKKENEAKSA